MTTQLQTKENANVARFVAERARTSPDALAVAARFYDCFDVYAYSSDQLASS